MAPDFRANMEPSWVTHLTELLDFNFVANEEMPHQKKQNQNKKCSCCCSVAQSCLTLCNPMDCIRPGFPVLYHLPSLLKLMSTESVISSNHLILSLPFFSCPQSFPASGSFSSETLFASGGQSIRALASASVLAVNIQGWFLLGLTGLISVLSKELSGVFATSTVQMHQFFGAQPALWPNSHICTRLV